MPAPIRARHALALAAALALAGIAPAAAAQSLQALYDAARGYDASFLAAQAQAQSAQHRAAQSDALNLPQVGLNGGVTRTETNPAGPVGTLTTNNQKLELSARQSLFNRANAATVSQAARALEVAQADLASAEQDLIVRVSQAYFDVLGAQDTLATAQAGKKAIGEQLASAKRNFEVGTATITDTREAQARFDLATAQEIAAENDLRTKRIALDQLVGRSGVTPVPLVQPVALPAVTPAGVDDWTRQAEERHPTIRKATLGLEVARLETEKARAGHLPTVDLVGALTNSRSSGSAVLATGAKEGTTRAATVGVQFSMPLFAGYAVQNRVKETVSLEEKSRNDLEAARRAVLQGTRQVFFGVQSGQAQVKALEAAEASSKLALEATQLGYKVGVRVNLDVLNAQTQLFSTQRDLAKARYDVLVNGLRLRQAAGVLEPADVAKVDQLLAR